MPDTAIAKVEDAIAAQIAAWSDLSTYAVEVDGAQGEAAEFGSDKLIRIFTVAYAQEPFDEQSQTLHTATINFEAVNTTPATGSISRANQTAIAHIVAAIASDRTVGGRLQDIQEVDVASPEAMGKDVDVASLQTTVTFFTPRDDWFTIIGMGGTLF